MCEKSDTSSGRYISFIWPYLPEAKETETARKVGGNNKKHLFWFVFVTRLDSVPESVRNASSDTHRKNNLNLTCRHFS